MIAPGSLGMKRTPAEVAELFGVAESTVLRYPAKFGGVRIGRKPVFFDNLIAERVRAEYAITNFT